jgi:hypothetical protein
MCAQHAQHSICHPPISRERHYIDLPCCAPWLTLISTISATSISALITHRTNRTCTYVQEYIRREGPRPSLRQQ